MGKAQEVRLSDREVPEKHRAVRLVIFLGTWATPAAAKETTGPLSPAAWPPGGAGGRHGVKPPSARPAWVTDSPGSLPRRTLCR